MGGNAALIDAVFVGNVAHTDPSAPYLARHVGLKSGVPVPVPALTVNRLCGSGFQAVVSGAQNILLGESEVVLTGACVSFSRFVVLCICVCVTVSVGLCSWTC